ncbi:MAG: hypothetical protein FJW76_02525, partial [Actinobacteria bacterium]|nr:hypothetical protein [Actinomycetota bacterium]
MIKKSLHFITSISLLTGLIVATQTTIATAPASANATVQILDLNAKSAGTGANNWVDAISNANITSPGTAGNTFPTWTATNKFFAFNGSNHIYKNVQYSNPNVMSIELWFRTTSTGAKIIGFQNAAGNGSGTTSYDRHLYIDNTGKLRFGLYNGGGFNYVTSSAAVNDGFWHHAVATYSSGTARLYVDGAAQTPTTGINTSTQDYNGFWVIGGGRLSSWAGLDNSGNSAAGWTGDLAVARVYGYELDSTQVSTLRTQAANAQQVTVTFDSNTGSGSMSAQQITYNTATAITSNSFTKTDHSFAGWATSSGGAVAYGNGAQITLQTDTTLYAKWNLTCSPTTSNSGGVTTLTFTAIGSCNWTVPSAISSVEVAVVGGGGGGAFGNNAGGGGAGEVLVTGSATLSGSSVINTSGTAVTPGSSVQISIGAGGTGGSPTGSTQADAINAWNSNSSTSTHGGNGGNSAFGSVTARGGGGGGGGVGGNLRANGADGGSGGGGSSSGSGGQTGGTTYSGWSSFKNVGAAGANGAGGGAGGAGVGSRGGAGVTVLGKKVAGGGGGWGGLGGEGSLTDSVLGGNGRLNFGLWPYAGTAPNYTSVGVANTGTGGGAGAPGGSGVVIVKYANAKLSSPSSVAATAISSSTISVTFNSVANAVSYRAQVFDSGGTQLGSDYANFTSGGKISALSPNTNYSVKIIAVGDLTNYNNSDPSTGASVTTLASRYLTFSGTSGHYASTNTAVIPTTGNFTIEAWISPSDYSASRDVSTFLSQGSGSSRIYFKLNSSGQVLFYRDGGVAERSCGSDIIPKNIWSHIAVSVSSNSATCYINGVAKSTNQALGSNALGTGFYIGTYAPDPATTRFTFAGKIDEVKVWNTARTSSEISNNLENAPVITDSALVAYFPFDETSGTSAAEMKSAANNLTLNTSMTFGPLIRTITYTAGTGGSGSNISESSASDHTSALTIKTAGGASSLSKAGASMTGWNSQANGSGTSYAFSATYSGSDSLTLHAQWASTLTVTTPSSGLTGTVASAYSLTISSSGGSGGNDFTITSGSLPAGLTLNSSTGVISGTPTTAGSSAVVVSVTDSSNATVSTSSFTITIGAATLSNAATPTVSATSATLKSINVSWNAVANASSYTIIVYASNGTTVRATLTGLTGTSKTITASDFAAIADNTVYQISLTAVGTGNYATSSESSKASVTTNATYTVTYNYNDATGGNSTASNSFIPGQTGITLPVPTRTHFTFGGWFDNGGFLGNAITSPYSPTANITLFAKWTINTYVVTFNKNDGTGATTTQNVNSGEAYNLTANSFTRSGFTFVEWTRNADGSGAAYANSGSFSTSSNITLYAQWTKIKTSNLIVNLDATNPQSLATNSITWKSVRPGSSTSSQVGQRNVAYLDQGGVKSLTFDGDADYFEYATVADSRVTGAMSFEMWIKPGSLREGWNILATRWFSDITGGSSSSHDWHFAIRPEGVNGLKLNLYTTGTYDQFGSRVFTSNSPWVLVGFTIDGSNNLKFYVNGEQDGATIANIARTNQSGSKFFIGDPRATVGFAGGISKVRLYNTALTAAEMLANFDADYEYFSLRKITFNENIGAGSTSRTQYIANNTATALTANAFTRSGFSFAGWSTTSGGSVEYANNANITLTGDATLYAVWTASSYTITLNKGTTGTGSNQTLTKTVGQALTLPNSATANGYFTRTGFTVTGWSTTDGGAQTHALGSSFTTEAATTLYPVWTGNALNPTFGTPTATAS